MDFLTPLLYVLTFLVNDVFSNHHQTYEQQRLIIMFKSTLLSVQFQWSDKAESTFALTNSYHDICNTLQAVAEQMVEHIMSYRRYEFPKLTYLFWF